MIKFKVFFFAICIQSINNFTQFILPRVGFLCIFRYFFPSCCVYVFNSLKKKAGKFNDILVYFVQLKSIVWIYHEKYHWIFCLHWFARLQNEVRFKIVYSSKWMNAVLQRNFHIKNSKHTWNLCTQNRFNIRYFIAGSSWIILIYVLYINRFKKKEERRI